MENVEKSGKKIITNKGVKICCAKEDCNNQVKVDQSKTIDEKDPVYFKYCGRHTKYLALDEMKLKGLKPCYNFIRGCETGLDSNYQFSRCEECLSKDREKDKMKRQKVNEDVEKNNLIGGDTKVCSCCFQTRSLDSFIPLNSAMGDVQTKTCRECRESNKRADSKRDMDHVRELARKNSKKEERVEKKKQWVENNYDKVVTIWRTYRKNQYENNQTEYLRKNAERMKLWRDNNQDKIKELNQKKLNDLHASYLVYKKTAEYKNLEFELSFDQFQNFVKDECFYCGINPSVENNGKDFHGIDRDDVSKGYISSNCVSCCSMCNWMKGGCSAIVFLLRVNHIIHYNKFNDEETNDYNIENGWKLFNNRLSDKTISTLFGMYERRAIKKNIVFELLYCEFNMLSSGSCYICGKPSKYGYHLNGVDRVDNNVGYIISNCKTCCAECNFMKKAFDYESFINKLKMIYIKNKKEINNCLFTTSFDLIENANENKIIVVIPNKKTDEEKKQNTLIRKEESIERTKQYYLDDAFTQQRALELAKQRKAKQNT